MIDLTPENFEQWLNERGGQATAIRDLLTAHNLSGPQAARIVGVTGRSFRRYMEKRPRTKKPPYPVPYAVIFTLLTRLDN